MKNLTPQHLRCEWGGCPSVHELEDGRLHIIGEADGRTHEELRGDGFKIGPGETAVIIDRALLSTIRDEVREECAKAIALLAEAWSPRRPEDARDPPEAFEQAAAAIRALKETPHE
jgi:hypothetical protein